LLHQKLVLKETGRSRLVQVKLFKMFDLLNYQIAQLHHHSASPDGASGATKHRR